MGDSRFHDVVQGLPEIIIMKCTIFAYSTSPHVSQLYTGFSVLSMNGEISLTQKLSNYSHRGEELMKNLEPPALNGLFVLLNDEKVLFYDTYDGCNLYNDALEVADVYFKRSYLQSAIPESCKYRVFPLGLNYELYTGKLERHELARVFLRKSVLNKFPNELIKCIAEFSWLSFLPTTMNMYSLPEPNQEPRVLFMARAWDPAGELPGLSAERKEERVRINETRARCIELLRKELGRFFHGGFAQTNYAVENFKELLLESASISGKKQYISLLRQHPICIATTGLHGSIGWKMGEYVAFSKSIVSERLNFLVPGEFSKNRNYLEFDTAERCLQQTMKLVEDRQMRLELMENNWSYYRSYLMPDRLIKRTLDIANSI